MTEFRKCAIPSCEQPAKPHRRTCSRACSQLWLKVYRFDTEEHRIAQAKTILASPSIYTDAQVRNARRTLGEDVPLQIKSKLKAEDIPNIRTDTRSLKEIADQYEVGVGAIRRVKDRVTWKHIP